MVGLDPGTLLNARLDPECLLPIEAMDLFSYLVLDTGFYTKEQFKASKSLESFNFLVSGFITNGKGVKISNKYVVTGKVRHSQRMLPIWTISSTEGTVLLVHCTGCKAGLAETCSHVAGLLFYIEAWARLHGQLACTQMKCSWIIPSCVKEVPCAPISEIYFKSARKL